MDLTVYLRHAAIQERNSYNMGKVGIFCHIFALAFTGSGVVIHGRYKCGNIYQACGFCYAIKHQKVINICQKINNCSRYIIRVEEYLVKNEASTTDHEYM